jgi:hypothetical protein
MPKEFPTYTPNLEKNERSASESERGKKVERMLARLMEITAQLGYSPVDTMQELDLTPEEIGQLLFIRETDETKPYRRFFSADRKDGRRAKILVEPWGEYYAADMFSPAYNETRHAGNHDFDESEMINMLKLGLE